MLSFMFCESFGKFTGSFTFGSIAGFPPFGEDSFAKIKKGEFSFKFSIWKDKSDDVKDLISKLMTVNPQKRYTIDQIFEHPWMKVDQNSFQI